MGLGKNLKKATGAVIRVLPGGQSKTGAKIYGLAAGGVTGFGTSAVKQTEREKQARLGAEAQASQQEQTQLQLAEQSRLRLLAEESVRLQQEEERKRTTFGGLGVQNLNERKKLLG